MNKHGEDAEVMPALPVQDIPAAPAVEAGMDVMIAILAYSNTNLTREMVGNREVFFTFLPE